jgi:plastocyanin
VRRAGLAIFAAAAALVGAVPAWSGDDGKLPPVAELSVSPESVEAGAPVALDASASRDPDGSVTSYAWDLDGDGAFERQSGAEARIAHAFESAGQHSVGVRVLDDSGASADATRTVVVAAPPEPEPAPEPAAEPQAAPEAAAPTTDEPAEKPEPARKQRKQRVTRSVQQDEAEPVQAAASGSVSIKDFSFAPRSVTVGVGDSVTFRNTGKEAHTATARDGSFDTGNLNAGQSGSVTFRKAGSFTYFCKPHAFMTGTVTVTGAGGGGSGGGGGGGTQGVTGSGDAGGTAGSSGGGTTGGGDDLPSTGLALAPFLVIGVTMLGSGVAIRRRIAH